LSICYEHSRFETFCFSLAIFGSKPKGGTPTKTKSPQATVVRKASSYRREIPPASAITSETYHAIDDCRHCGDRLVDKQEHIRFEEDIVLAALTPGVTLKTTVKQTIERGYCTGCGKYSSAQDLRGQTTQLGPQVRSLITYLICIADHSYEQVRGLLWQLYQFPITDGEITLILDKQRTNYLPAYQEFKDTIRAGPAHLDESRYSIQSEQGSGYVWSMSSTTTSDVVFHLADSRGKGHATALTGTDYQGVGITDRYAAYKHLFLPNHHQICWVHLQR